MGIFPNYFWGNYSQLSGSPIARVDRFNLFQAETLEDSRLRVLSQYGTTVINYLQSPNVELGYFRLEAVPAEQIRQLLKHYAAVLEAYVNEVEDGVVSPFDQRRLQWGNLAQFAHYGDLIVFGRQQHVEPLLQPPRPEIDDYVTTGVYNERTNEWNRLIANPRTPHQVFEILESANRDNNQRSFTGEPFYISVPQNTLFVDLVAVFVRAFGFQPPLD